MTRLYAWFDDHQLATGIIIAVALILAACIDSAPA